MQSLLYNNVIFQVVLGHLNDVLKVILLVFQKWFYNSLESQANCHGTEYIANKVTVVGPLNHVFGIDCARVKYKDISEYLITLEAVDKHQIDNIKCEELDHLAEFLYLFLLLGPIQNSLRILSQNLKHMNQ